MARAVVGAIIVGLVAGSAVLFFANRSAVSLPRAPAHAASWASPTSPADDSLDQATRGAGVYAEHCRDCHGDRGQGLTLEWRQTWDPEHQNCGRSNCHGLNHPPDGFYLPGMYAPAIVGPGALDELQTARDLFNFISTRMPFQEPGVLPPADYWALTAYLVRQNGIPLPVAEVGEGNASGILLHPPATPTPAGSP